MPSHSMNERLWNDVNLLDNIFDWNCGLDYEEIFHQPPHQSQKISITTHADEVVTSSATDLVCNISSLSSDARYSHSEVDKDLIPGTLSQLDITWAMKKWIHARCFDKMLPRENPSKADAVSFYTILLKVCEFRSNKIMECLLEYYNLSYSKAKAGDMIYQMQDSVMKSSAVYSDEYLRMCLLFMKYPFTYDFDWFQKAIRMIEDEYSIKVPIHP